MNRLFLPLNRLWYDLFVNGEKSWELRGISKQYNEHTIYLGRVVEIRLGYKNGSKFGKIDSFIICKRWEDLPEFVRCGIFPEHLSNNIEMKNFLDSYLEKYKDGGFIAFKIIF